MHAPTSPQKKCAMKMKQTRKKRRTRKCYSWREALYKVHTKNSENDLHELQVNDYGYNEGTICLVNGQIGASGMVFQAWVHK